MSAIETAVRFVRDVDLPPAPQLRMEGAEEAAQDAFDAARSQAAVVGSDVISFVKGVTAEARQDVVNCALLAQLAANKSVPDKESLRDWYRAYFDTLTNLGWVAQEQGFSEHHEAGSDLEAHKAVLRVAAVLLGPGSAALAVVKTTLDAMGSMTDKPWMTIFKRESQTSKAGRFQVTVVEPAADGGFMVALMAFELAATTQLTQVLFFKFRASDVTLKHASGRVTINTDVLAAIRAAVADRIAEHSRGFVAQLPI